MENKTAWMPKIGEEVIYMDRIVKVKKVYPYQKKVNIELNRFFASIEFKKIKISEIKQLSKC